MYLFIYLFIYVLAVYIVLHLHFFECNILWIQILICIKNAIKQIDKTL